MIVEYLIDKDEYKTLLSDDIFKASNGLTVDNKSTKYKGKENHILRLSVSGESLKNAEALSEIAERIKSIFNNKNNKVRYRLLINEPAQYFVKELYPLVCEFETRLREFIHGVLFDVEGKANDGIIKKMKSAKIFKRGMIENGNLFELSDLGMIIDFLFSNNELSDEIKDYTGSNQNYSREDLIELIKNFDKHTIWEDFFKEDFSDSILPEKLKEIKEYRNDVMHFHDISYERYLKAEKILKECIKDLKKQINKKIIIKDSPENITKLADHCSAVLKITKEISDAFSPSYLNIATYLKNNLPDIEAIQSIVKWSNPFSRLHDNPEYQKMINLIKMMNSQPNISLLSNKEAGETIGTSKQED